AHLVEASPADGGRPVLHTYRYAMPGDEHLTRGELIVFDTETGTRVEAQDPILIPLVSPIGTGRGWWAEGGSAVYFLDHPRDQRTLWLKRLDAETGAIATLIEERGETRVEPAQTSGNAPSVRVLPGGAEALWWSQRDGWGHLYLFDTST